MQAQYYCEDLKIVTEKKEYKGKPNKLIKGITFINNDVVNLSSNLISALMVLLIVWFYTITASNVIIINLYWN